MILDKLVVLKINIKILDMDRVTQINHTINKVIDEKDLIGKTIESVHKEYGDMYLKFTDGTYAEFHLTNNSSGFSYGSDSVELSEHLDDANTSILVGMGIISNDDYIFAKKDYDRRVREASEQDDLQRTYFAEKEEREQYEKLKKKFE